MQMENTPVYHAQMRDNPILPQSHGNCVVFTSHSLRLHLSTLQRLDQLRSTDCIISVSADASHEFFAKKPSLVEVVFLRYVRVSPEAKHAPADVRGAHVDEQQIAQEWLLDHVLDAAAGQDGHDVLHRDQRLA